MKPIIPAPLGCPVLRKAMCLLLLLFCCALCQTASAQNPTVSVSGVVSLEAVAAGKMGQPIVFTLTPTGTTTGAVTTQTVTLNAQTGAFTLTDVPPGTYILGAKGSKWLRKDTPISTLNGSVAGLNISLLGGDLNDDNKINIFDYLVLSNAYNSVPGDANWNPNADIDCNGRVNIFDYLILSQNYQKQGDP